MDKLRAASTALVAALLSGCATPRYSMVAVTTNGQGRQAIVRLDSRTGRSWTCLSPDAHNAEWELIAEKSDTPDLLAEFRKMPVEELKQAIVRLKLRKDELTRETNANSAEQRAACDAYSAVEAAGNADAKAAALRHLVEVEVRLCEVTAASSAVDKRVDDAEEILRERVSSSRSP